MCEKFHYDLLRNDRALGKLLQILIMGNGITFALSSTVSEISRVCTPRDASNIMHISL